MSPAERLRAAGPRLALDTMCFVYHFEANPRFVDTTRALFGSVERGDVSAVASALVLTEVLVVPMRAGAGDLVATYRRVLTSFPNLSLLGVDVEVAEKAAELRARHGLRTPDALHVATAIVGGASAFVTGDRGLTRIGEIRVVPL